MKIQLVNAFSSTELHHFLFTLNSMAYLLHRTGMKNGWHRLPRRQVRPQPRLFVGPTHSHSQHQCIHCPQQPHPTSQIYMFSSTKQNNEMFQLKSCLHNKILSKLKLQWNLTIKIQCQTYSINTIKYKQSRCPLPLLCMGIPPLIQCLPLTLYI